MGRLVRLQIVTNCLHVTVTSVWPQKNCVRSIAHILYIYKLFEVGIPNLVFGYILGSRSVTFCFWVTVSLTSGLSSRKIVNSD